jgi:enterochelin esterase-like enzyme
VFALAAAAAAAAAGATPAPAVALGAIAEPAGGSVEVSGTGFAPGSALSVELDGQPVAAAVADATGALAPLAVAVPATTPVGRHAVAVQSAGGTAQAWLAVEPPGTPAVVDEALATRGAGTIHFAISLPADAGTRRYPVLYFLHGLPGSDGSYTSWPVALDDALGPLASEVILVAPQAARAGDTDPEYLDEGAGRDWADGIAVDLPRYVDAHFPTIASRAGRALVGVSAGGYGAVDLGLHHLGEFSVIESWSGYFEPTTPDGRHRLELGTAAADARASAFTQIPSLRARFRAAPTFLGFYVGRGDERFLADNRRFHRALLAAGVPHTWGIYRGGHQVSLWLGEAPFWVGLALRHLAPPTDQP